MYNHCWREVVELELIIASPIGDALNSTPINSCLTNSVLSADFVRAPTNRLVGTIFLSCTANTPLDTLVSVELGPNLGAS